MVGLEAHWRRRQWHPTPALLPRKSHGRRSLVGCSPWGRKESDTTERLHFHFHALEKEMATHSSVLAWRIPGMGEPGGLPVYGVAQSRTRLKRLSSSSSSTVHGVAKSHKPLNTCQQQDQCTQKHLSLGEDTQQHFLRNVKWPLFLGFWNCL